MRVTQGKPAHMKIEHGRDIISKGAEALKAITYFPERNVLRSLLEIKT